MKAWLREHDPAPSSPLFPNARGQHFSPDGIQYLLSKHARTAQHRCPSLKKRRVSPHVLRHTTAMELLQAGVDRSLIALWLGHESVESTQVYVDANLAMKEEILAKTSPRSVRPRRYRPSDRLMVLLEGL